MNRLQRKRYAKISVRYWEPLTEPNRIALLLAKKYFNLHALTPTIERDPSKRSTGQRPHNDTNYNFSIRIVLDESLLPIEQTFFALHEPAPLRIELRVNRTAMLGMYSLADKEMLATLSGRSTGERSANRRTSIPDQRSRGILARRKVPDREECVRERVSAAANK